MKNIEGGPYRKGPTQEQQKEIEAREKAREQALEILRSGKWSNVDKLKEKKIKSMKEGFVVVKSFTPHELPIIFEGWEHKDGEFCEDSYVNEKLSIREALFKKVLRKFGGREEVSFVNELVREEIETLSEDFETLSKFGVPVIKNFKGSDRVVLLHDYDVMSKEEFLAHLEERKKKLETEKKKK